MRFLAWLFGTSRACPSLARIGEWKVANPTHGERRPIPGLGYREWDGFCQWWRVFSEDGAEIDIVCPEWEARRNDPEYASVYATVREWLNR